MARPWPRNLPLADIAVRGDVMAERARAAGARSTTTRNCAVLAEARSAPARGATDVVLLTLGTGHRRRARAGRRGLPRLDRRAAPRSGTWWSTWTARRARATARTAAAWRSWPPARRWCARRRWRSRAGPDTALGHALEEGRELTGPLITELAHDGDPVARDAIATIGRGAGRRASSNLVNIFNPRGHRDRRRRDRGGRAAARPGARGDAASGRCAPGARRRARGGGRASAPRRG